MIQRTGEIKGKVVDRNVETSSIEAIQCTNLDKDIKIYILEDVDNMKQRTYARLWLSREDANKLGQWLIANTQPS